MAFTKIIRGDKKSTYRERMGKDQANRWKHICKKSKKIPSAFKRKRYERIDHMRQALVEQKFKVTYKEWQSKRINPLGPSVFSSILPRRSLLSHAPENGSVNQPAFSSSIGRVSRIKSHLSHKEYLEAFANHHPQRLSKSGMPPQPAKSRKDSGVFSDKEFSLPTNVAGAITGFKELMGIEIADVWLIIAQIGFEAASFADGASKEALANNCFVLKEMAQNRLNTATTDGSGLPPVFVMAGKLLQNPIWNYEALVAKFTFEELQLVFALFSRLADVIVRKDVLQTHARIRSLFEVANVLMPNDLDRARSVEEFSRALKAAESLAELLPEAQKKGLKWPVHYRHSLDSEHFKRMLAIFKTLLEGKADKPGSDLIFDSY